MCCHIKKVFSFLGLSGRLSSLKWIILMPVGFYCLFDLQGTQCLGQHGVSSKTKQTQLPRPRFEIVPRSLRFLPHRIWDRYPCQLPMIVCKGRRVEKVHVFKAAEELLSCSLHTYKIGKSGGGVGRREEKEITCLFPPLSRYPSGTTLSFLGFIYSSGSSGLTDI